MTNYGTSASGKTNAQDAFMVLVSAEARKSGVGLRHLEGPSELARRVLTVRGTHFTHLDSLPALVTKLTEGGKA